MTLIARTAETHAPYDQAIAGVAAFFEDRPHLTVRGVAATRAPVDVRYELLYDWTRLVKKHEGVAVMWRPRWRGFPSFGATLTVRPSAESALLVLEGSYEPPGGAIGRLFDRAIGARLAAGTMDALLSDIVRYVRRRPAEAKPA